MSKIGIDIRSAQLGSGSRGIGKYIFDLVEGLVRVAPQHEYVLIALSEKIPPRLLPLPACCRVACVSTPVLGEYKWTHPVPRIWRVRYLKLRYLHALALQKAVKRERLDVLHITSPLDEQFFAEPRGLNCRVVTTFHDAIPAVFPQEFIEQWPEALRYTYRMKLAAIKEADTVVAISESARQDAIEYADVPANKLCVVYNTVSEDFYPVKAQKPLLECQKKYNISKPYFLFCSAPEFTKNRPRIIKAFAQFLDRSHEPYQLVMVSPKEENPKTDVRRLAFDLGLSARQLIYTGFVSEEELNLLYSGATALLSPSLYEGFGLPAGQAMRSGTPVIASNRSSQPEVVGDAGILVDPYDAAAIADAMHRLAQDPQLRSQLSARGEERVKRFDWRYQAENMLKIYTQQAVCSEASLAAHQLTRSEAS